MSAKKPLKDGSVTVWSILLPRAAVDADGCCCCRSSALSYAARSSEAFLLRGSAPAGEGCSRGGALPPPPPPWRYCPPEGDRSDGVWEKDAWSSSPLPPVRKEDKARDSGASSGEG